ncbi:hypothetical protein ACFP2T_37570 [Plantactinospora solaniradicis]|uniref:Uncharacterized protein n=1 Tax=Plantactinospora solaniradicis TaxID=1723736 RepID=A0ABW1KLZ4_9ACTN
MNNLLDRLYRTKLVLLATLCTGAGAALLLLASSGDGGVAWLKRLPVSDFGSALLTTGLVAILFEYVDRKDGETRAARRLRQVLADEAPAIRDAVVDGFAFEPQRLANVASPETLDRIIGNCLTARVGNSALATDTYADIREQLLRAAECWYDLQVSVALAPWMRGPASGRGAMLVATVRHEYKVVPPIKPVLRFASASHPDRYRELLRDPSVAKAWYFEPLRGLDAASLEAFRLVQFTADGRPRRLRHAMHDQGHSYRVTLGKDLANDSREVAISYTYQALVQRSGHLFHLDIARPTKGLKVEFWYGGCGIRHVNVLDYVSSAQQPRISRSSASASSPSVAVSFDGWVRPKAGVAFVWVLEDEVSPSTGPACVVPSVTSR